MGSPSKAAVALNTLLADKSRKPARKIFAIAFFMFLLKRCQGVAGTSQF